jgi:hypothetical protein
MRLNAILFALLTCPLWASDEWVHPGNARGAAQCVNAYLDNGDTEGAEPFVRLGEQEDYREPALALAVARFHMTNGVGMSHGVEQLVRKHPEQRESAARTLLAGAKDIATSGRENWYLDVMLSLRTAIELDPSLREEARTLSLALVRNAITSRNAIELLPVLLTVRNPGVDWSGRSPDTPEVTQFMFEIAECALVHDDVRVAGRYLESASFYDNPLRPRIARHLVLVARELQVSHPHVSRYAIEAAMRADPTLRNDEKARWMLQETTHCGRAELLQEHLADFPRGLYASEARRILRTNPPACPPPFLSGGCGLVDSPFGVEPDPTDEHYFAAVPLPDITVEDGERGDPRAILESCKALSASIFPEPFDTTKLGRTGATVKRDDISRTLLDRPGRCIEHTNYDLVVDASGSVRSAKIRSSRFVGDEASSDAAIRQETENLLPRLMKLRFEPARIMDTPVVSLVRSSAGTNCDE